MEIRINDRTFTIPDDCPMDGLKKSTLRRTLREHGAESCLTSRKLSPFAGCLTDELLEAGAESVDLEDANEMSTAQDLAETPQK